METPKTLLEAVTYFADPDRAHAYAVRHRWPNGVACPRLGCGSANVLEIKGRHTWKCRECKRQFSVKVGTVFESSPLSLSKWLPAVWLLTNTKNGTSSCELARALGVTQKTAWFMFHRIRLAMGTPEYADKLTGYVEADETYLGGKGRMTERNRWGHLHFPKGPTTGKTAVLGMIERGEPSHVRARIVPDTKAKTLAPIIRENVAPDSFLFTDALRSYRILSDEYRHAFVDHTIRYVEGRVHTNTIENFWSCLKRTLKGTYIAPRAFHLDAYLDEQVFRFNERADNDSGRFVKTLKGTDGKRLTYKTLTTNHPIWRLKPGRAKNSPLFKH